ncbi:hypothetical protein Dcar01_02422 [Deinococcus carri]|uniref:Uncharacterized protein n=1 Tax=Deinococcus carri TaxID=1211323 RepID=A0ABP9WAV8_9DEIO
MTRVEALRLRNLRTRAIDAAIAEMQAEPGTPERAHLTRRALRLSAMYRAVVARLRAAPRQNRPIIFWEIRRMDDVTWEVVGRQATRSRGYQRTRLTVASVQPEAMTVTGTDGEVYPLERSLDGYTALLYVEQDLRNMEAVA